MGVLDKLKASLQPALNTTSAPAADGAQRVWEMLDSPDGTHFQFLDRDFVPNGLFDAMVDVPRHVLDVGCYCGGAGVAIKRRWPETRVTGIEPLASAADIAADRLDRVFRGRLEDATPSDLDMPDAGFDTIICADVLEHLYNPWAAMKRLRTMLANDGVMIASIPNARNLGLITDLACRGRFEYRGAGLLDITHIRFFTEREIRTMFRQTGYLIEALLHFLEPRFAQIAESADPAIAVESLRLDGLSADDRRELATLQFVVRASKAP